ncbi:unnamed protein product, partial [Linum tenue]
SKFILVTKVLPILSSGEVQPVKGISKHLSAGQVVWAPSTETSPQYLIFVGWSSETRKLGIKYCYNRPCGLYAARAPFFGSDAKREQKWVPCFGNLSHLALVVLKTELSD